jgi:2-keto-4-pentenoate hydratase/2-oxohepta-3-ene-1,7-dioic acid hydratase in catechol pathway
MRLITYRGAKGPRVAAVRGETAVDLNQADPSLPSCIKALLGLGPDAICKAAAVLDQAAGVPLESLERLPLIPKPEKIICVGLNYADHARESGAQPPPEPVFFCKFPTAASAPGAPIVLPRASSEVDYEAELVLVIGRGGRHIPKNQALQHIAGYCCGNDVSARDWQLRKPGGQWLLGKSFDSFAPFGPTLVTADEIEDPGHLRIQSRINGRVMQDSTTLQLIFTVEELVSYISNVCTLAPGDVLFTGTPPGVGFARKPPVFLKAGDVVEVEIEKLGVLRNPVVAEKGC